MATKKLSLNVSKIEYGQIHNTVNYCVNIFLK